MKSIENKSKGFNLFSKGTMIRAVGTARSYEITGYGRCSPTCSYCATEGIHFTLSGFGGACPCKKSIFNEEVVPQWEEA